jgi:Tfp pilus assembly protein PilO
VETTGNTREKMGLQHAIDDMAPDAGSAAPAASDASEAAHSSGAAGSANPLFAILRGLVSGLRSAGPECARGRRSVWKVTAIAILTYVITVNLAYFFVLKPVWARLDGLLEKKTIIQDFLVVRESSTAVAAFRDGLMRGDERVTVLNELRDLARSSGVKLVGEPTLLSPKEISKAMTEYPLEIQLTGSYHDVGVFLSAVESSPRYLMVRDVQIDADKHGPEDADAHVTIVAVSWES